MAQLDRTNRFAALKKHRYMNLFTYRQSGEAVKTPVWFALKTGKIYLMAAEDSGKIQRIRNNPRVLLGPADRRGNPRGETVDGMARILAPHEEALAKEALDEKYGLTKAIYDFFMNVRGTKRAWVEIVPA